MSDCCKCGGCPDVFSPEYLNARCGREGEVEFYRREGSGLPTVRIRNPFGVAEITLYGAHVLNWTPTGQAKPVIWLSDKAVFAPGKPIRGGIPVCWPWFGACSFNPKNPAHGFARISFWNVHSVSYLADGRTAIEFVLRDSDKTREWWPNAFQAALTVVVGWSLEVSLKVTNTGDAPWTYTGALHTYFGTGDITRTTLYGLEGTDYLDTVGGSHREMVQDGPVTFTSETDRIYRNTAAMVTADDRELDRQITIVKDGSISTVVWNPWIDKSIKMVDFGDDEYKTMFCVEAVNTLDDEITLDPGASHTLSQTICVE